MNDMSDMNLPPDERSHATAAGDGARVRAAARAAMLEETLQLGRYSAFAQAAVVLALAIMFWNIAPQAYLGCLAGVVTALCAAAFAATRHYRGVAAGGLGAPSARGAFLVLRLLALGRGLAWGTMPAVLLPSLDNAYRVVVGAV